MTTDNLSEPELSSGHMTESTMRALGDRMFAQGRMSMVMTDPNQPDNPIVYVNKAFEQTTGYSRESALGRNCRFLQGNDRDQASVDVLREHIAKGEPVSVELRNYTAAGERFTNRLLVAPIEDDNGKLVAFMGIQVRVPEDNTEESRSRDSRRTVDHLELLLRETNQRVKGHLSLLASLLRQARPDPSALAAELLAHRVEALSLLYDDLAAGTNKLEEVVSAGEYVSKVTATLSTLDPTQNVRFNIATDYCLMGIDRAALVGLIVSETISVLLAQPETGQPRVVGVSLKERAGNLVSLDISTNQAGAGPRPMGMTDSSRAIVEGLAEHLDGRVEIKRDAGGARLTLDFGAMH